MTRLITAVLAACLALWAQPKAPPDKQGQQEQEDLDRALAEAAGSPLEYLHAIQKHLAKYPKTSRRTDLERAGVRAAIEVEDDSAIVEFGERVLGRQPDDLQLLDRVSRILVKTSSREGWERALKYARRYETLVREMQQDGSHGGGELLDWRNQTDRALARALNTEARASGNLGRPEDALALARRGFEVFPNADSARELARWYEGSGKFTEAAAAMADAFTVADPRNTDADRERDRGRMGELYRKAKGSEEGLGQLVLEAYDRNLALVHARQLKFRAEDPNGQLKDPLEFTLGGVDGGKLQMASLKGKVLVLDFWATWCGPCRSQHPLYDKVKARFQGNERVVFLSLNTDEDRELVKPFLAEEKWPEAVYFDDGLTRVLAVTALPTTVVIDGQGKIFSKLSGYVPDRFVDMLNERIEDALKR